LEYVTVGSKVALKEQMLVVLMEIRLAELSDCLLVERLVIKKADWKVLVMVPWKAEQLECLMG